MFRVFTLLFLSLIPLTLCGPLTDVSSGLTLAGCINDDACRGDRKCLDRNTQEGCSEENTDACFCYPSEFRPCDQNSDCELGEYCGKSSSSPPICAINFVVPFDPKDEDSSPLDCPPPFGQEEESGDGDKLSYETCNKQGDCRGSRRCVTMSDFGVCCSSSEFGCVCIEPSLEYCANSGDCDDEGEVCLRSKVAAPRCVSSEARVNFNDGRLSEGSGAVCVDTKLLKGVEKVFEKDRVARVLCDQWGQCATKGHMVTWANGKVGMWKTYCEEIGGCKETVKMVNSPKWKRGLRIEGKDVSFTAFAARWASKTEEKLLRGVMRMGL